MGVLELILIPCKMLKQSVKRVANLEILDDFLGKMMKNPQEDGDLGKRFWEVERKDFDFKTKREDE